MASALLASSNEPCWGEQKVYMRKNPISNPNPRPCPNLFPGDHAGDRAARFRATDLDDAPPAATAVVSDDSSSFNRKPSGINHRRDTGVVAGVLGGHRTFAISTYSKTELRELKRRLVSELDQVRSVMNRIQSREMQSSARSAGFSASGIYCGGREVTSSAGLASLDPLASRPSDLFSAKAKKVCSNKAALQVASPREPKRLAPAPESEKLLAAMMKKCGQILSKLMKHKKSIWFNSPVDVVGMGLHDYFQIVKNPMDLGTVKTKLNKGLYPSPVEFAFDIRLTFNNALLYNPAGHEVHKLADQFLRHFEGLFGPAYQRYEKQRIAMEREEEEEEEERPRLPTGARVPVREAVLGRGPDPRQPFVKMPSPELPSPPLLSPASAPPPQMIQDMHRQPQPQASAQARQHFPNVARTTMGRLPKPKAKDPNKRPMSLEEKQKLSEGLQSLPQEKMNHVLNIMRKRNVDPVQNGDDEIELDIDVMDTETLWELDRFLCNCKKMMSKIRRQEAMASGLLSSGQSAAAPAMDPAEAGGGGDRSPMMVDAPEAKKSKKGDAADEDVDIGDELPVTNYPSVEIQKDTGYASSSSSSDSDSSSSSDSDSGSSSDGDSDDEADGRSPAAAGSRSPRN